MQHTDLVLRFTTWFNLIAFIKPVSQPFLFCHLTRSVKSVLCVCQLTSASVHKSVLMQFTETNLTGKVCRFYLS